MASSLQLISSTLQLIPFFRGKRRICKLIINKIGIDKVKKISIKTKSGRFILPNLNEIISFDLFISGAYEKGLVEFLDKSISPNGVFIDVGANIGSISIPLALKRPDIRIIAIEASSWIFDILKLNIDYNRVSNIFPINYAVFGESGKEMAIYAPKDLFGKGSLKPIFTKEAELVETITIDDVIKKFSIGDVDFLKVDVEGFEASVFSGMVETIKRIKPKIVFEFSEWAETSAGFSAGKSQEILLGYKYELQMFDRKFKLIGTRNSQIIHNKDGNLLAS